MSERQEPSRTRQEARKPREVECSVLLDGRRELVIVHNGERYTLRITGNNKLILTK